MSGNPIKYSDFVESDDSIKNLITQLNELIATQTKLQEQLRDEAKQTEESVKKASAATEQGQQQIRQAASEADKLTAANDKLAASRTENAQELARLKEVQREQNNVNKLTAKLNRAAEGSYDKLSAQYSLNKIKLNAMSKAERESTEAGRELEAQSLAIREEMKRLQESTGNHTLSVGDYEKGWRGVTEQLQEVPGAAGEAVGGFDAMSDSAKALLKNPVVLFIAALVAGLTALGALFSKTSKSAELMQKVSAYLEGTMSALVGVVDTLADYLINAFENPQQALKDFGNAIINNVVNRFKALIKLASSVGDVVGNLLAGDFDKAKKSATEAGKAVFQMTTGLDEGQVNSFSKAIVELTSEVDRQAKAFVELAEAQDKTRDIHRSLERSLEAVNTALALSEVAADNATTSFKAQAEAAKRSQELLEKKALIEKRIASDNLKLITKELDMRLANGESVEELIEAQLEAYKVLAAAEREYLVATATGETRASQLKQDRLEKDLDILIDGFDKQKAINEKLIGDEKAVFEVRKSKLNETKALFEKTFDAQINTIQEFTGKQVNAQELIQETDAVTLNQKIRSLELSEIIEGRLLEIINERKTGLSDLAEAEKKLNETKEKLNETKEKEAKKQFDAAVKSYGVQKEIADSEIDLLKETEATKTELKLEAEKDRLNKILALNKEAGGKLTKEQVKLIENQIKAIDQILYEREESEQKDLYEIVGLSLSEEKKEFIGESTQFAIEQVQAFVDKKVELAEAAVDASEQEVSAAQTVLEKEIENREKGYASNVSAAQRELALAKKTQEAALKDQEKARKAQATLETIQQIGGLVTGAAKIWGTLGFPWAIPAIALMFGSFAYAKVKANKAAKAAQSYGDGGLEFLQGGSHASGNDINIGRTNDGRDRRAEGGEAMAIINKRNTAKYKGALPGIIDSLNRGTFFQDYDNRNGDANINIVDTTVMENGISELVEQGKKKIVPDGRGGFVEVYKNVKRTISC